MSVPNKRLVAPLGAKKDKNFSGYDVEGGINGRSYEMVDDGLNAASDLEILDLAMRNLSTGPITKWSWWNGLGLFFAEMIGALIYVFLHLSAAYVFPGVMGSNHIVKAFVIATAVFFVKVSIGRWTSSTLDPVRTIFSTLTWIFSRGSAIKLGSTWLEILKAPFFIIAQWLGALVAVTFFGLWTDAGIKTSDCALASPTPAICYVYPTRDPSVSGSSLYWMEFWGSLLIFGSFILGERIFAWKYSGGGIVFSALFFATGHFIVHLLWGGLTGGSFNFWFWSTSSWFSNIEDDYAIAYVWPCMVAAIVASLIDVLVYYLYDNVLKKEATKESRTKDT